MKNLVKTLFLCIVIAALSSCKKDPPEFIITASATHFLAGQSVTFSENAEEGAEATWILQGSTTPLVVGSTVTTTYNTAGIYTVQVTVKKGNLSTTKYLSITVEQGTWIYQFPGGENNNNTTIGDFCCTGQTITVKNYEGKPLGYAYFYSWQGDAYNLPNNTSIAPNFEILISGGTDLDGVTPRQQSKVFFPYYDDVIGKTKTVKIGNLEYTVKILEITYPTGTIYADTHFNMGSLKVEVKVRWVP